MRKSGGEKKVAEEKGNGNLEGKCGRGEQEVWEKESGLEDLSLVEKCGEYFF